jgi:hypothetical protein
MCKANPIRMSAMPSALVSPYSWSDPAFDAASRRSGRGFVANLQRHYPGKQRPKIWTKTMGKSPRPLMDDR